MNASNIFIDSHYPAMEPSPLEYQNTLFGRRFGALVNNDNNYGARYLTNLEVLLTQFHSILWWRTSTHYSIQPG